jgi:hypothetical protein
LDEGIAISEVRSMLEQPDAQGNVASDTWTRARQEFIRAIGHFDETRLEQLYSEVLSLHPVDMVTRRLLMPLLRELGTRWESAVGSVAEEHFFRAIAAGAFAASQGRGRAAIGRRGHRAGLGQSVDDSGFFRLCLGRRAARYGGALDSRDVDAVCHPAQQRMGWMQACKKLSVLPGALFGAPWAMCTCY